MRLVSPTTLTHTHPTTRQVATPGRVLDLASKGVADLSKCHTVIMDEADKLLSPEFQVRERYYHRVMVAPKNAHTHN